MAGMCKDRGGFAIIAGGYYDHAHLLAHIPAKIAVAEFVGKFKADTSRHINDTSGRLRKFGWQDGYGAFTVSVSNKDEVDHHIHNQEDHHRSQTFEDEYLGLSEKHEVEYDSEYVFD